MKTVGIIGGVGPESTIEYYRFIIAGYRARKGDASYPSIIINSIDLNRLIAWMNANELDSAARYLSHEIERLARAGADFGARRGAGGAACAACAARNAGAQNTAKVATDKMIPEMQEWFFISTPLPNVALVSKAPLLLG